MELSFEHLEPAWRAATSESVVEVLHIGSPSASIDTVCEKT